MPYPRLIKIDRTTDAALAAFDAEERFFAGLGLSFRDHDVDVKGLRVRVLSGGEGAPLLILPGFTGDGWIMGPLLPHLAERRILLLNLPGAGLSDGIDYRSINARQLALEVIAAVLEHFSIDRVEIVASGFGGAWAFWFAVEYPERVPVITQLGCPALIEGMKIPMKLRFLSVPPINKLLRTRLKTLGDARRIPQALGHSAMMASLWTDAAAECAYRFAALPQRTWLSILETTLSFAGLRPRYRMGSEELRHVKAPVQFIWGEHDPFGGSELAGDVVVRVPSAILHETPGGHMPWWDEPEQCGSWIRGFHDDVLEAKA